MNTDGLKTGGIWTARLVVAAVFIYAAVPKIVDPAGFAEDISNYQAFPYWSWNLIATVVPMLELCGAVALLTGIGRRGGALLLGILDAAFMVLIMSVIVRDIDLSCGCFGHEQEAASVGWPTLFRDAGLMIGIMLAGLSTPGEASRSSLEASGTTPDDTSRGTSA